MHLLAFASFTVIGKNKGSTKGSFLGGAEVVGHGVAADTGDSALRIGNDLPREKGRQEAHHSLC